MALPLSLISAAEQWIDSSLAGMLNGAMPLFTALVATAMMRRAPSRTLATGLLVGFAGVLVLSWPSVQDADASALGVLLVVLATLSYGVAANVAVPLQQRYGAIPILARGQLLALVLVLPGLVVGLPSSSFAIDSFAAVLALGALGTGLAFVAAATLMGRVGATRGSVITYLMPVVSITLGVAFRDEIFDAYGAAGILLVLSGAYLASRAQKPPPILVE
jgi:drug/metabolite transporter (DMT)-like permease